MRRAFFAAPLLFLLALLPTSPLAAKVKVFHEKAEFLRLLEPMAGATFEAGGRAELRWVPGVDLASLQGVHEWEAFLSVDGGRTWAFRITAHVDLARQQIAWKVPDIVSDDVRLLLRVGDERIEHEQLIAGRFAIAPRAARWAPAATFQRSLSRGEAARPGEPGVLSWIEELPDGRSVEHHFEPSGLQLVAPEAASRPEWVATLDSQRERERDLLAGKRPRSTASRLVAIERHFFSRPARSQPILLLVQRLNE